MSAAYVFSSMCQFYFWLIYRCGSLQGYAQASKLSSSPPHCHSVIFFLDQMTAYPHFDESQDQLWDLDWSVKNEWVELIQRHQVFMELRSANNWLRSKAFHQIDTESLEGEQVLQEAWQLTEDSIKVLLSQRKGRCEEAC